MKLSLAVALLLATSQITEASKVKSQSQIMAEIEAMSLNANMHQVSLREKTLLKTYLQVDMNEFFQQKMDSDMFEGVDERSKAEFIGNFFHWTKCRFSDCNLLQTKSKINLKTQSPTAKQSKKQQDKKDLDDWASGHGNNTPAWSNKDKEYVQTKQTIENKVQSAVQASTQSPTASQSKKEQDKKDLNDWASGHGNNTPAWSNKDKEYVQIASKTNTEQKSQAAAQTKVETKSPTAKDSKIEQDKKDLKDWGTGHGNNTPAFNKNDKQLVQTKSEVNTQAKSETKTERPQKMVSPAVPEVNKMLQEEAAQELVKPTIAAGSEKDTEPKTA